jgi:hypothetical protein
MLARALPIAMDTGSVPERLPQRIRHRLCDFGRNRGGRIVIEIQQGNCGGAGGNS